MQTRCIGGRKQFDLIVRICKLEYFRPTYWLKYYTIIDFNEVDIRIYLPEKVIFHRGRQAEVNITFEGRYILMSTEIEVNDCFVI